MEKVLQIHPQDNLLVALQNLEKGEKIIWNKQEIILQNAVSQKHKFALEDIAQGEKVIMYGVLVGKATRNIAQGEVITTHNLAHATENFEIKSKKTIWQKPDTSKFEGKTFWGYHRSDGKVGTANYWLLVPLVFCENRNIEVLKEILLNELGYQNRKYDLDIEKLISLARKNAQEQEILKAKIQLPYEKFKRNKVFKNIDGIKLLTHEGGCGGTRADSQMLCKLLAGYLNHPNVAGATILSLGCQNAQISLLQKEINAINPNFDKPIYFLEQQQSVSEPNFIEEAIKKTFIGLMKANEITRKPAPLSALTLGLKCGGSDGFSGISANPALGYAADLLVALGGKALLAEFPELNGVEQELIYRIGDKKKAEKFANLMKSYAEKAKAVGSGFEANPSPGNIKDGLITDAMKSAGAAKKGGSSPIVDVLDYAEQAQKQGLHLLCTPGNDVEATTGLAGSGANVIVFTTGLGTPTGNPVAPTIKMATNNELFKRMKDILDINAGSIITGEDTIQSKGEELLELIIKVASGKYTPKAVLLGQDDFIPWKRDISL